MGSGRSLPLFLAAAALGACGEHRPEIIRAAQPDSGGLAVDGGSGGSRASHDDGSGGDPPHSGVSDASDMGADASSPPGVRPDAGGNIPAPGVYEDDLVQIARYTWNGSPGPTFVEITDVEATADRVYVCTATQGLLVLDRPTIEVQSATISSVGRNRCQHVAPSSGRAIIANRGDEYSPTPHVTLFDFADAAAPIELATLTGGESYEGVVPIDADTFAVAVHDGGVAMLRYDGTTTLKEIGRATGLVNAWDLDIVGTTLYVADGANGVRVVDVSDPTSPSLGVHVALTGSTKHVSVAGDRLFASSGAAGVHVLDISDPTAPSSITQIDTPGSALMSTMAGDHLYVADWNDVRVFDLATPSAPTLVATENIAVSGFSRVLAIDAVGDRAYVGEWTGLFDYEHRPATRGPDIRVPAFAVTFAKAAPGEQAAFALVIANEGEDDLVISAIDVTQADAFEPLASRLSIPSGEQDFVEVRFRPTNDLPQYADLVLTSDDPDEETLEVRLIGNPSRLFVGDAIPDHVWSAVQGGDVNGQIAMADLRGSVVLLSYFATF